MPGFFMCAWYGALAELLAIAGGNKKTAFPDGSATPIALVAGQGQFPELGRLEDACGRICARSEQRTNFMAPASRSNRHDQASPDIRMLSEWTC
ncbi:MAG: hypothetical protein WCA42_20040, partial [Desulfobacterales bacterium]